jgi:hypothetical protein
MLVRYIVTAILATASLFLSFKVTKSIAIHFFDEIFVKVTNFESCDFDSTYNFDNTYSFDLFEDFSSAFQSAHSSEPVATPDADTSNSSSSDTCPLPLASDSFDSETHTTTGHSGSIVGTGVVFLLSLSLRALWFMRFPPPAPDPPLPPDLPPGNPPTPDPPPDPPPYMNPHVLWPNTWIGNFPCVSAPTTQEPESSRPSRRLRYFSSLPPTFPEEELGWDGELLL